MVRRPRLDFRVRTLLLVLLFSGCSDADRLAGQTAPAPPDVGDVSHFLDCTAPPRRPLHEAEQCQLALLRQDCTPFADCLVSCISAPDGHRIGGGCAHVCGRVPSTPGDQLPDGFFECGNPQVSAQ
jgi:hypothetical protein